MSFVPPSFASFQGSLNTAASLMLYGTSVKLTMYRCCRRLRFARFPHIICFAQMQNPWSQRKITVCALFSKVHKPREPLNHRTLQGSSLSARLSVARKGKDSSHIFRCLQCRCLWLIWTLQWTEKKYFYMHIQVYFHSRLKVNVNGSQLTNINMLLFLRKGHNSNFRSM